MDYRHEWKHELNYLDLLTLRARLRAVMEPDPHAVDGRYEIRSLYFDSLSDKALREFCRLRSESVRGQLEDRIPSTSEGQRADSGSLIDAGSITLSDMGSMGGGRGGFGGGFSFSGSETGSEGEGDGSSGFPGGSFGGGQGQGGFSFPGGSEGQGASGRPSGAPSTVSSASRNGSSWLLAGLSAAILAIGIFIAFKYKRY